MKVREGYVKKSVKVLALHLKHRIVKVREADVKKTAKEKFMC